MQDYTLGELEKAVLICVHHKKRLFTVFSSYIELMTYLRQIPAPHNYYEIILGEYSQKPHFDLELNRRDHPIDFDKHDPNKLRNDVLEAILATLKTKEITLDLARDVLFYQSHGPDKISFHIVIDNYCHANHLEARSFYLEVYQRLPAYLRNLQPPFLDPAVYSRKQQFRLIGSEKYQSGRPKTFIPQWSFHDQNITYIPPETPENPGHAQLMRLKSSLVSCTIDCQFLPSFGEILIPHTKSFGEIPDIAREEAEQAVTLLAELGEMTPEDSEFPYRLLNIRSNIVILKRLRPSHCRICQRIHHAENPFLQIIEDRVYFHCRRAPPSQRLLLGSLKPEKGFPGSLNVLEKLKQIPRPSKIKIEEPLDDFGNFYDTVTPVYTPIVKDGDKLLLPDRK